MAGSTCQPSVTMGSGTQREIDEAVSLRAPPLGNGVCRGHSDDSPRAPLHACRALSTRAASSGEHVEFAIRRAVIGLASASEQCGDGREEDARVNWQGG